MADYKGARHALGPKIQELRAALDEIDALSDAHRHKLDHQVFRSAMAGHLHEAHGHLVRFKESLVKAGDHGRGKGKDGAMPEYRSAQSGSDHLVRGFSES